MTYILGHNPDEFGLVPDREGFITFKELLWAFHEEPGWSYVRQSSINEVLLSEDRTSFEVKGKSFDIAAFPKVDLRLLPLSRLKAYVSAKHPKTFSSIPNP